MLAPHYTHTKIIQIIFMPKKYLESETEYKMDYRITT